MATVTTQSSWILLLSGIVLLMVHSKMKTAIAQAIKVMGDRFGSTEQDVAKAIQELKASMQGSSDRLFP